MSKGDSVGTGSESVDFLRTLARAESLSAAEKWHDAALMWEQVTSSNPVEGRFWSKLAEAQYHARDLRGAIVAYRRALDLRDGYPAETAYRIARAQNLLGEPDEALASLMQARDLGLRDLQRAASDDDFASLRDDARFRDLLGMVDMADLSRDERWRHDLRMLAREVKRRAYDPFRHAPVERFDAAIIALDAAIPDLSDWQIVIEMNTLLRLLGDGHAWVWPPDDDKLFWQTMPVQIFLFGEGLFITAAAPTHADLLGGEVLGFGERTAAEAMAAVDAIVHRDNENSQWPKQVIPRLLRVTPLLHALGVAAESNKVELTIRELSGSTRKTTLPAEFRSPDAGTSPYPEGWSFFPETLPGPRPLYLRNMHAPYWFTFLRDDGVVYFQFNAVRDDPSESFSDFSERMFHVIDGHNVEKLVIDVRWNGGGNTFLIVALLHRLIASKVNRRGALFVIIGRGTFSAAQNFTSYLFRHTEAIFVGEPTGSSPTFVGETVGFELPCSKTSVNVSDLLWQGTWPMDYRTWIAPTLYTPPTFAAFRANRDPAMEAILACREHLPGW